MKSAIKTRIMSMEGGQSENKNRIPIEISMRPRMMLPRRMRGFRPHLERAKTAKPVAIN